jgi:hypothetical protein
MKFTNFCIKHSLLTLYRENLMKKDLPSINVELSNLLDFTQKEAKKFNSEFIERVENLRKYEEQVKSV